MSLADIQLEAETLPISAVVRRLVELAGVAVTGAVGNAKSASVVRAWIRGIEVPEREEHLRLALVVACIVEAACGLSFVQPWFKGANVALDDRAPALVLGGDLSSELRQRVLNAAKSLGA